MSDVDQIAAGREAWERIKQSQRVTWEMWLCVGRALLLGRSECMKVAGTNSPKGGRYNYIANQWLAAHGFADVCAQERSRIVKIIENLPAVSAWRETLPLEEQRKLNHPSLWFRFRASVDGRPMPRRYPPNPGPRLNSAHVGSPRQVYWSQSHVERAARAVSEAYRGGDCFVIARRALESAIRSEADLIALLDDRPPPAFKPKRKQLDAPAALELA